MSRRTRFLGLILEWSCHGVPWIYFTSLWILISLSLATNTAKVIETDHIWNWHDPVFENQKSDLVNKLTKQFCLLGALILDAALIGLVKEIIRRPRPKEDKSEDMHLTVRSDIWSFPSGHASRASMLAFLIPKIWSVPTNYQIALLVWSWTVAVSRFRMRRHHVSDVCAGYLVGLFEAWFVPRMNWSILPSHVINLFVS